MQFNERDVLRTTIALGGVFLFLAILVRVLDPMKSLPPADADHVQAGLTWIATISFGALSWGLLHVRTLTSSRRLDAWKRQREELSRDDLTED